MKTYEFICFDRDIYRRLALLPVLEKTLIRGKNIPVNGDQ